MKKKYIVLLLLVVLAVFLYALIFGLPGYDVWKEPSDFEPNPKEGVSFTISANRSEGKITVVNNSDRYLTLEFTRKAPRIEVWQEDGWHRILSNKHYFAEPWAVGKGESYTHTVKWSKLLGGNLKPGSYRAILFHGDGMEDVYHYSTICEFTVK